MILVSACLLGHKVKYNGGSNDDALLQACSARGRFVAVCPECFAMLPVPRPPMEIQYGTGRKLLEGRARAVDATGRDLTSSLLLGAQKILRIARRITQRWPSSRMAARPVAYIASTMAVSRAGRYAAPVRRQSCCASTG